MKYKIEHIRTTWLIDKHEHPYFMECVNNGTVTLIDAENNGKYIRVLIEVEDPRDLITLGIHLGSGKMHEFAR